MTNSSNYKNLEINNHNLQIVIDTLTGFFDISCRVFDESSINKIEQEISPTDPRNLRT